MHILILHYREPTISVFSSGLQRLHKRKNITI